MKKITAIMLTLAIALASLTAPPAGAQNPDIASQEVRVSGADFSAFSNDKDAAGEVKGTGSMTVRWESITGGDVAAIRYRKKGTEKWIEAGSITTSANELTLENLDENKPYEWSAVAFIEGVETWSEPTFFHTMNAKVFKISTAKGLPEGAQIKWSVDYALAQYIGNIVIKYNTKLGDKHGTDEWIFTDPMPATKIKHMLEELRGGASYVYKLGASRNANIGDLTMDSDEIVWSSKGKFKTDREWGLFKFMILLGALGVFIFGMKIMSEGLQQAAGNRMRQILGSMTSNRLKGVFSGFMITGLVQSSSATTVMTVSFVNAGLLTLVQSAGLMMGANIGTTITGWLITLFGFKVSIASYALVIIALGTPFMFFKSTKARAWGNTLLGFAILFMGLGMLKSSVPSLDANSVIVQFFVAKAQIPILGTLMFVGLGTLVTIIIQSSSAAMALTLTLCANGVIPFEVAAAMILGENIGTTITAEIASMIGNVHAKRSARIHSVFNIVGVTWMVFLIPFFLKGIGFAMENWFGMASPFGSSELERESATTALAAFHTVFNALNVILLIWFVPQLVNIAIRTVKSKGDSDEELRLEYIDTGMMATPELSVLQAKKEVAKFGEIAAKMGTFVQELLLTEDSKLTKKLLKKVHKYEEITDRVEEEISQYLLKVSQGEMSPDASLSVRSILSIANDLERVGDIFFQMSKAIERKKEEKLWFTPAQRENIIAMFKLLERAFKIMQENLNSEYEAVTIQSARDIEYDINGKRNELRKAHLKSIENGDYNIKSGLIYNDLFSSCEKIGDHIINVTEAVTGEV